jgi:hypothetical protein
MSDIISNFENATARRGLYRVWIRAHEGENAALICVWIDPAMRAFEPSGEEEACDFETAPDLPHRNSAVLPGHAVG